MRIRMVRSIAAAALAASVVVGPARSHAAGGNFTPRPITRTRIQIGPPISRHLLAVWRKEAFDFTPLTPPGKNVDVLRAIQAADAVFVRGPGAYVFAVRYGRMTNPREDGSGGWVWIVMYQHDTPMPTVCPAIGCLPSTRHQGRYAQTNAVVDALTGEALSKFETAAA